jgi:tRNA-dihydrouridine synthase C
VLRPETPALALAPMDGITDAPMRAMQGGTGAFDYCVTEFIRVSIDVLPRKVFTREVPELAHRALTPTGLPVQVQILGGDPDRMAASALNAIAAGATAIDINFGCPAPTVNRNDGGASLLRHPTRIRDIVRAVRDAVPAEIPVSAKLRLGWESIDDIHLNAAMAAEGGATWLTIHARTRMQSYKPPVFWKKIGMVRQELDLPIIANGDIWTLDDFKQCQDDSGCVHFMLGRAALANPALPHLIRRELGLDVNPKPETDWLPLFQALVQHSEFYQHKITMRTLFRLKQWMSIAHAFGDFLLWNELKRCESTEALFANLGDLHEKV